MSADNKKQDPVRPLDIANMRPGEIVLMRCDCHQASDMEDTLRSILNAAGHGGDFNVIVVCVDRLKDGSFSLSGGER